MTASPIPYSPDVETIREGEAETVDSLNQTFDDILETTAEDYQHAVRAVHAKAHGVLQGTMTISADLPPELAQGIFAKPGEHKVFIRLSTNAGDVLPDVIGLPRGLAIKVLDVEGERLPGADGTAQDFVMVNGDAFVAKTADKFLGNLKMLSKTTDKIEGVKKAVSATLQVVNKGLQAVGVESPVIANMGGAPNIDPLGETYFSVTPFRYGDYIAKFSLVPQSAGLTALTGEEIDAKDRPDAIRETVQEEMRGIEGVWAFQVQLCRDLEEQPVEDATKAWSPEDAPFQTVAIVRAGPQDSWSPEQVQAIDEAMRFSPWTGVTAHRPLGDINRARRETYEHSANFRAGFNGCPIHEPTHQ